MHTFKIFTTLLFVFALNQSSTAQKIFSDNQLAIRLIEGDTVVVKKPSIIIDTLEFNKIRLNLENYKQLRSDYQKNITNNKKLLEQLLTSQSRLDKVLENNELQTDEINKLKKIVSEINSLSEDLAVVNDDFESNNQAFDENLEEMRENNKRLNREISRLRIKNIKSHILTGLVGATLGVIIASSL